MNFEEKAQMEAEAFTLFKQNYIQQHPKPEKPMTLSAKNVGAMFWLYVVNSIAALLLAAMRTTETFYKIAMTSSNNPLFAKLEASLAVFAIEGGLVVLAASRAMKKKKDAEISGFAQFFGIAVMILISIFAGLTQSISAVIGIDAQWVEILQYSLMIILGVGVSIIAYIGGEIIGQQIITVSRDFEKRKEIYQDEIKTYNDSMLASWRVSPERKAIKNGLSISSPNFAEQPKRYRRASVKKDKIIQYLNETWKKDGTVPSVTDLSEVCGAAKSTASEARTSWFETNPAGLVYNHIESIFRDENRTPDLGEVINSTGAEPSIVEPVYYRWIEKNQHLLPFGKNGNGE